MRRVVRGADGVDVVPLHQQHVLAHGLQVERAAPLRVPLVPVDALEEHGRAVDLDQTVLEHDGPETDAQGHPLALRHQLAVVQLRGLRRPRQHSDGDRLAGRDIDVQGGHQHPAVGVGVDPQGALAAGVVVGGVHEVVEHTARRTVQQCHVTEDARQPPLVLVLQIRPRRPLVDTDREHVPARLEEVADRELVRQPRALELADVRAVQPDPGAGLHTVETEHHPAVHAASRTAGRRPADGRRSGSRSGRAAGPPGRDRGRWCRSVPRRHRRPAGPSGRGP